MTKFYRDYVVNAHPDNRVDIWKNGRKFANLQYTNTHPWRAEVLTPDVNDAAAAADAGPPTTSPA